MVDRVSQNCFRSTFSNFTKEKLSWFPGHMTTSFKKMQQRLRQIDIIIEVHDARIPFSGKNENFKHSIQGIKPHILLMNKVDLIDTQHIAKIKETLTPEYPNILFTNCKDIFCNGLKALIPLASELISKSDRYNRTFEDHYNMMIIGIPNVGKSSVINALRAGKMNKRKSAPVAPTPGVTRSVMYKTKVCEHPPLFIMDTPGILPPQIQDTEIGLKMALCNTILNHQVPDDIIADYLLYWLNKNGHFQYVEHFCLERPTDEIMEVLCTIAKKNYPCTKIKSVTHEYIYRYNIQAGAQYMLREFRDGRLGKYVLDIEQVD